MMPKYLAEFIGTFSLVFCGCGAILINDLSGGAITHPGVATVFGLIVAVMIYSVGDISGAHFNPAVSFAFAISGSFSWQQVPPYVLSQCLAAILASGLLLLLFPEASTLGETLPAGSVWQSFVLEILLTFFLMFVIINVAQGAKEVGLLAGLAIGFTVLLAAMLGGPISGASMNPARSLGPALCHNNFEALWIYLTAPFLGSGLAVVAWRLLRN